jgi:hypothetical protein
MWCHISKALTLRFANSTILITLEEKKTLVNLNLSSEFIKEEKKFWICDR